MAFSARHHHENFEFSTEDGDGSVGVATEIVVRNKASTGDKMPRLVEICNGV
jgi:hypothetical protein